MTLEQATQIVLLIGGGVQLLGAAVLLGVTINKLNTVAERLAEIDSRLYDHVTDRDAHAGGGPPPEWARGHRRG